MDLEEWELLPDEGFIDLHDDHHHGGNDMPFKSNPNTTTTVIDMNYFQKFVEPKNRENSMVIPMAIQFDQEEKSGEEQEEVTKLPSDEPSQPVSQIIKDQSLLVLGPKSDDQEMVSKVFFNKLKENEFVDMKMDSPKSLNRGILPQIDVGTCQFEGEEKKDGTFEKEQEKQDEEKKINLKDSAMDDGGLNIWKWAMSGMGALVSFGFAAATVSVIVLSNRHKENNHAKKKELHFRFYTHDKRFKQVVRRAKRLNEAITVMRGAPITRAHITVGGYYEGL